MKEANQNFTIPIKGLKRKIYHFEYNLDKEFFAFENALIDENQIKVLVTFNKLQEPYVIDFDINGTFKATCDKCTSTINVPLAGSNRVYVEYSNRIEGEVNDEVVFIENDTDFIELKDLINDFVILALPLVNACDDPFNTKFCDPEVAKYLEAQDEKEVIEEKKEENDPRWDKLKNINL